MPEGNASGPGAPRQKPGTPSLLRELNDRAALELLLAEGPLTRAQLSERTGVSKVTVSQMLARLEDRGLVMIVGEQAGGRGPNAALYSVVPSSAYVAGLYVESDLVSAAVADVTGQRRGRRQRGPQRRRRPGGDGPRRDRPGLRERGDRLLRALRRRHRQPRRPRPADRRAPAGGEPAHLARGRARRAARGTAHPGGDRERREPRRDGRAGRRGRGRARRLRVRVARHRPRPGHGHQRPGAPGRRRRGGRDRLDARARRAAARGERASEQDRPAGPGRRPRGADPGRRVRIRGRHGGRRGRGRARGPGP